MIMEWEKGIAYKMGETVLKTGDTVVEVLQSKHPNEWDPLFVILEYYIGPPLDMVHMDLMVDTVMDVSRRISEGVGTERIDPVRLHNWILCFCEASAEIWMIVSSFAEWTENQRTPWVEYWLSIAGRLIGLDKYPDVIMVEVMETCRRLIEGCILEVAGP